MVNLTAYIVLIVFVSIFDISQCSDDCFYHPGYPGKKCYEEQHTRYTCCPLDHRCDDGKCVSLNASPPSDQLPVYHIILIAAGTGVFTILGIIIIGAIYWHRKQMKITETPYNAFASFSKSTDTSTRSGSSVGFRTRTSPEASVNIHIPSITNT